MSLLKKEIIKKLDEYIKINYIPELRFECCVPEPEVVEDLCDEKCEELYEKKPKRNGMFAKLCAPMEASAKMSADSSPRKLDDVLDEIGMTFSQSLFKHIENKGLTNAEVYKKAGIDRKLFSKIQCNPDYKPNKKTAIALALALELNKDETKDLIARAGYAFSPSSVSDIIIQFFIENGIYDIYAVNEALYEHNEPVLI